jgi:hypothetical protein
MAIENGVVCNLYLVVKVHELLHILVIVLHIISLSNVTNNARIESLNQKFQRTNSERVTRLQII